MEAREASAVRQAGLAAAIALAVYGQLNVHRAPNLPTGWIYLAAAALLAALVARRRTPLAPPPAVPIAAARRGVQAWLFAALGIAAIGAATALSTLGILPVVALLSWLVSGVFGALAVRGWRVAPARRAAEPWTGGEWVAVAALLALAAMLRMLWIDELPRVIFGDEPRVAMYLFNAYNGGAIPNFFSMGWNTWPVVGLSLQGLLTPVLGLHIDALRLSSALMGTLAVLTTYLMARELFDRRTALLAAVLFALCRTAIDFSRLGITHAQVLFLEPLAFYFLWRAINGGWAVHYLWAGITTGWCLYTYNAGQLVPPLMFGWLALAAVLRPRRLQTHWRGAALLALGFALTLFPYLYYFTDAFAFTANWGQWTIMARNRQTLAQVADAWRAQGFTPAWELLRRQIWTTWLGFGVLPGGGYALGYRRGGMLDDVTAALFFLGLAMSIRRLRRGADAFPLYWWFGTVFAGGIATIDPPSFVRMVGILPVLAMLAALPLDWLLRTAAATATQAAAALAVVALVSAAAWQNWETYFVEFAAERADPITELARYLQSLPPDHQLVVLGSEHFLGVHNELFLIEFPGRTRDIPDPPHFFPVHEPLAAPLTIALSATQSTLADYVRTLYPGARVTDVTAEGEPLTFRSIILSPAEVEARAGLALRAERDGGAAATVPVANPFDAPPAAASGAQRLEWTGSLYWGVDRPTEVTLDAGQPTTITFDGGATLASDGQAPAKATLSLPLGWHPIRIEERVEGPHRLAMAIGSTAPPRNMTRFDFRPDSTREGLDATYRRPDGVVLQVVDPQLNAFSVEDRFPSGVTPFMRMPFTASWRGNLRVDRAGQYEFDAIGSGPYRVLLDGTELVAVNDVIPEQPLPARAQRALEPGLHPIAVEFDSIKPAHTTRRLFQLFWTPPGGERTLVPPSAFERP